MQNNHVFQYLIRRLLCICIVTIYFPASIPAGTLLYDKPGWPAVFELNTGESIDITRRTDGTPVTRTVRLLNVTTSYEPDYHIRDNPEHRTFECARVAVEVSGVRDTLLLRPYQFPKVVNGLRLYVEMTRLWGEAGGGPAYVMRGLAHDVRFSYTVADETWGPETVQFPIRRYRWHASTYHNTWGALVPYNNLYYHRGEDFGAVPDRLDVAAMLPGTVTATPLPDGDGGSNGVIVFDDASGLTCRYAHMNTETINPALQVGRSVAAGMLLGKTGETWNGKKSQKSDPHLHTEMSINVKTQGEMATSNISPYPFQVESYFRMYDDPALAQAGGYAFTMPGRPVLLDGSRSVARPGRKIAAYRWTLHDGQTVDAVSVPVIFDKPGLYSEELTVAVDDGREAHGFLQVRVYDPVRGRDMAAGWVHYTPVRGIAPGAPVTFWNRIGRTTAPMRVDFGDGSPEMVIDREIGHRYAKPGWYRVTFRSTGPGEEPVTVQTQVVVEP